MFSVQPSTAAVKKHLGFVSSQFISEVISALCTIVFRRTLQFLRAGLPFFSAECGLKEGGRGTAVHQTWQGGPALS
jgi:hypothetical protein